MNNKNKKIITYTLLFLIGLIYYFIHEKYNISIPCVFHEITHLYCLGCGISRMFISIFQPLP